MPVLKCLNASDLDAAFGEAFTEMHAPAAAV